MTAKELYINILNNQQSFWLWNSDQCISRSICSKYKQNTSKERSWCALSNCCFKEIRNSKNWLIVDSLRIICQYSQDQQCRLPWTSKSMYLEKYQSNFLKNSTSLKFFMNIFDRWLSPMLPTLIQPLELSQIRLLIWQVLISTKILTKAVGWSCI